MAWYVAELPVHVEAGREGLLVSYGYRAKDQHPSGRPIRREKRVAKPSWNHLPDPAVVYATPRLRPQAQVKIDAVGFWRPEEPSSSPESRGVLLPPNRGHGK